MIKILIFLIFLRLLLLVLQYFLVLLYFICDKYNTKKELFNDYYPFFLERNLFFAIRNSWKKLE